MERIAAFDGEQLASARGLAARGPQGDLAMIGEPAVEDFKAAGREWAGP